MYYNGFIEWGQLIHHIRPIYVCTMIVMKRVESDTQKYEVFDWLVSKYKQSSYKD